LYLKSIALVTSFFYPTPGGVSRHIFELARAFSKMGLKVFIITLSTNTDDETIFDNKLKENGIEVIRLNIRGSPKRATFLYSVYTTLKHMIKRGIIDCVHFSNESGFVFYLNRVKLPSVTKVHGSWLYQNYQSYRNWLSRQDLKGKIALSLLYIDANSIYKVAYKLAPALIVIRREVKDILSTRFGISRGKLAVVPNGVNREIFNPRHNQLNYLYIKELGLNIDPDVKVILYVGDFSYLKGFHFLPLIIKKVLERYRNVVFLIAGAYSNEAYSKGVTLLKKYGILKVKNIKIMKFIPFEKMPVIYAIADIVILPYVDEITNVHKEAMAMGKPLVTFELRDISISLHRKIAMFVPRYNVDLFVKYIFDLLNNETLAQYVGRNAAKFSLKWSWDNVAKATLKILREQIY